MYFFIEQKASNLQATVLIFFVLSCLRVGSYLIKSYFKCWYKYQIYILLYLIILFTVIFFRPIHDRSDQKDLRKVAAMMLNDQSRQ